MERVKQLLYDLLKEQQMKLGYFDGASALFFPEKSFDHLLEIEDSEREDVARLKQLRKERITLLRQITEPTLGPLRITRLDERFRIEISRIGNEYVRDHVKADAFTKELVNLFANHHVSLEQVKALFSRFDENYELLEAKGSGFEYIFSLSDKERYPYYYLMHQDGEHMTYHRYLEIEEFLA